MKLLKIFLIILIANNVLGQNKGIIYEKAIHFQITENNDTINFIVADTTLNKKKPVFLFCQGSLPIPLFVENNDNSVFMFGGGISNFDYKAISEKYHLVVISMPKTPLSSHINHLNSSYCYIPDTTQKRAYRQDYMKADYAKNYILRANIVLDYLAKQEWVDNSKLVVAGHSQGAIIATLLTAENKNVTHLGIFGYNRNGRIDQKIREERKRAEKGQQSWEKANNNIDYWIYFYKQANDPEQRKEDASLIAWYSFSKPSIDELLTIGIPIFMSYGTKDITSDLCDLIPLKFVEKGKDNLTIDRKVGLEHNFFEVDDKDRPIYTKGHWIEVMNEFVKFTEQK